MKLAVIIPALNEAETIAAVVRAVPASLHARVIVVDNGSSDGTGEVASGAGAEVIRVDQPGYGRACRAGAAAAGDADVLAFLDGDGSDDPASLPLLLEPLGTGPALVLGSRRLGVREPGALTAAQIAGNWLAVRLIAAWWGPSLSDIPSLRAIDRRTFESLGLSEPTYGWPVEMVARAAVRRVRIIVVPAPYRGGAAGASKVSGSVRAGVRAAWRMAATLLRVRREQARPLLAASRLKAPIGALALLIAGVSALGVAIRARSPHTKLKHEVPA